MNTAQLTLDHFNQPLVHTQPIMRAITIKQPWATLITAGIKDVENRTWTTSYRGRLLIHAGKALDRDDSATDATLQWMSNIDQPVVFGAIIAVAHLVNVVQDSPSRWALPHNYHWCLTNPIALPTPVPCRGSLGLWRSDAQTTAAVDAQLAML